jgi:hypothetical protein
MLRLPVVLPSSRRREGDDGNTTEVCVTAGLVSRDRASEFAPSPSLPSSLTHVRRCIGYRNPNWAVFEYIRMYAGASVIATQTGLYLNIVCLSPRD